MPAPRELVELHELLAGAFQRTRPIDEDAALTARVRDHVAGNDRLTPAAQADIYRRQFWLRHFDALAEDYLGLAALLGPDAFDDFVTAYLVACPPRHPSLRDLGDRIVAFAEGYAGFPADKRAAALEMVRYENAIVDVFDGAEPPPLDAQKLAAMPEDAWDRARIVLSPLLFRMRIEHPVHTYRIDARAAADAGDPPPPFPAPRPVCLGLFRRELIVSFEELDPAAFALLGALARGEPLPRACDQVAAGLDEAAAAAFGSNVGPWFQQWTAWRWIVDVVV